jgi:hypothetical protein
LLVHLHIKRASALPNPIAALQHVYALLKLLHHALGVIGFFCKELRDFVEFFVVCARFVACHRAYSLVPFFTDGTLANASFLRYRAYREIIPGATGNPDVICRAYGFSI